MWAKGKGWVGQRKRWREKEKGRVGKWEEWVWVKGRGWHRGRDKGGRREWEGSEEGDDITGRRE